MSRRLLGRNSLLRTTKYERLVSVPTRIGSCFSRDSELHKVEYNFWSESIGHMLKIKLWETYALVASKEEIVTIYPYANR